MKKIKNANIDLERKRPVFFQIGIICALALSVAAFEWTTYSEKDVQKSANVKLDESIPIESLISIVPDEPSLRRKQKTKPVVDDLNLIDDNSNKGDENPQKELDLNLNLDIPYGDGEGDCADCPEDNLVIDTKNVIEVANKPHYRDCALAEDILDCTSKKIVELVQSNARYPRVPFEKGIEDTVYVQFTVDERGNITNVAVAREGNEHLDKEAVRAVKSIPRMIPGTTESGLPVRTVFTIPVRFRIAG